MWGEDLFGIVLSHHKKFQMCTHHKAAWQACQCQVSLKLKVEEIKKMGIVLSQEHKTNEDNAPNNIHCKHSLDNRLTTHFLQHTGHRDKD